MAQKLSFQTYFVTARDNTLDAVTYLDAIWAAMSGADQATWAANAYRVEDLTGYWTFKRYFMGDAWDTANNPTQIPPFVRYLSIALTAVPTTYALRATSLPWIVA